MRKTSSPLTVVVEPDQHYARVSAAEVARRSAKGTPLFPIVALVTVLSSRIADDFPALAALVVLSLVAFAGARIAFARNIEKTYDRLGEGAVRRFGALMALQSLTFSGAGSAVIWHYGDSGAETFLVLIFCAGACAAATSTLAPRPRLHQFFLLCIQAPTFLTLALVGGREILLFLLGFAFFGSFLVREGIEAGRSYQQLISRSLEVENALAEIRTLRGIIPICASCKRVRVDGEYWEQVECYVTRHTHALFSHGLCPPCEETLYPEESEQSTPREKPVRQVRSA